MILITALLAIAAGAVFGVSIHLQRMGLRTVDDFTGTLVSISATVVFFWIVAPFAIDWRWFGTGAAALFAVIGIIFPAVSHRLQIASAQRVGPALTSAFGSFAPLFAVLPAILLLGETMNARGMLGMALMIAGLISAALGPSALRGGWPAIALALPLGAAFVRGIVQPATKLGMAQGPNAVFATLVMTSVSGAVIAAFWARRRPASPVRSDRRGVALFVGSGLCNATGILALNMALQRGEVSVAAPLASLTPLWTLVFGALVFRTERLARRHLVVAALVVAGAVLIVTR